MEPALPGELRVANTYLAQPLRLRALFAEEGYLYFRDVLDHAAVRAVHRQMVHVLIAEGMAGPGEEEPVWTGPPAADFMAHGDGRLQHLYRELRLWERLVASPPVEAFFTEFTGGPPVFIPLARYRIAPPGGVTSVHRDGHLNPGFDMTTAWIPLMRIDAALGGLALVPGSHHQGRSAPGPAAPPAALPGRDAPSVAAGIAPVSPWHRAAYEPGDVVLMHEALAHTGLVNRSRHGVRLSVDIRFQNPSAPAAVIGEITARSTELIRIRCDDGRDVTLTINSETLLRGKDGGKLPRADVPASELAPGSRVIASRRAATAVVVRPL